MTVAIIAGGKSIEVDLPTDELAGLIHAVRVKTNSRPFAPVYLSALLVEADMRHLISLPNRYSVVDDRPI